jgi:ABC-type phosphate transport system substrate-binding protein
MKLSTRMALAMVALVLVTTGVLALLTYYNVISLVLPRALDRMQIHARVKATEGGIGYIGLGFVDSNVKALKIDGVMPTKQTIAQGTYPVSRPLFLFTNGYPKLGGLIHAFCIFYLSEEGQEIIEAKGFVPVTNY